MTSIQLADWWPVGRGRGAEMRLGGKDDQPVPLPAHAGLWLDRMLAEPYSREIKEWTGRRQLYLAAVRALTPAAGTQGIPPAVEAYRQLFARWQVALKTEEAGLVRRLVPFAARSRLLLHPASNSTVTDGSVLLHYTYGVPYLPGSGLKGALRSRLDKLSAGDSPRAQEIRDLTGEILGRLDRESRGPDDEAAGGLASLVDFYDALWIPEMPPDAPRDWSPLALDIVNPHHPAYYTEGEGSRQPPSDTDEPIPVQRLSIAPKTRFLVVMEAPSLPELAPWQDWLLEDILVGALTEDGIGAWTSAGYGRLEPVDLPRRASSAGRPARHEPAVEPDLWHSARVFYEPGRGELRAVLSSGGPPAVASRVQTQELLSGLPGDLKAALTEKRKREAVAEVKVVAEGRSWRISALRPQSSGS